MLQGLARPRCSTRLPSGSAQVSSRATCLLMVSPSAASFSAEPVSASRWTSTTERPPSGRHWCSPPSSATLRHNRHVPRQKKAAYVDKIIGLLELHEMQDAIISSLDVEQIKHSPSGSSSRPNRNCCSSSTRSTASSSRGAGRLARTGTRTTRLRSPRLCGCRRPCSRGGCSRSTGATPLTSTASSLWLLSSLSSTIHVLPA